MITRSPAIEKARSDWRALYADAFRHPEELLHYLGIDHDQLNNAIDPHSPFPLRVPLPFAERMEHGNPDDPLLLQVLPLVCEQKDVGGFIEDPLSEAGYQLTQGVIKKYRGRALVVTTGACAVHCRYCFRRHYAYHEQAMTHDQVDSMLDRLAEQADLEEIIFSGGDPLSLSDARLTSLLAKLPRLQGLQRIRLHTRLPVVLPQRMTDELITLLIDYPLPVTLVLHANHPNELDDSVHDYLAALKDSSVTLLNQAVLLRNINDDPETLAQLSMTGFSMGILPYYLHQLDKVAGAGHFAVDDAKAQAIYRNLQAKLPGYLVPRLVRDTPGLPYKELLSR